MKTVRKIIEIDEERCDGCGQCVISCAEGALEIIDGKARLVSEVYCDGLGACLGECPQGALHVVERKAEAFDPEAVEAYLEQKEAAEEKVPPMQCPSARIQTFPVSRDTTPALAKGAAESALGHWPVQIRLIPPTAPFLKGADLLVAADCVPVAYARFHEDFLAGRVVLIGCPKFDNVQEYLQKFAQIFEKAEPRSVTVLTMEVPCCSGLPMIVRKAMEAAGKTTRDIPVEEVVIGARGKILERNAWAA